MDTSQHAHESQSEYLIITLLTTIVITIITFVLRVYTRVCLLRSIGAEDYFLGFAMVRTVVLLELPLYLVLITMTSDICNSKHQHFGCACVLLAVSGLYSI